MWKWFVFIAFVIGFCIVVISHQGITDWALDSIQQDEGAYPNNPLFDKEKLEIQGAPPDKTLAFQEKYGPFLQKKYYVFRYAYLFGEVKTCYKLVLDEMERFKDTPMEQDEYYQKFCFFKGRLLDDQGLFPESKAAYLSFVEKFPDNKLVAEAKQNARDLEPMLLH